MQTQIDVTMPDGVSNKSEKLFRKLAWRILPVIFVSYCIAFLDRVNIGFTQLQMGQQIGLDPAQYGFAAGIFFLTYAAFELPSNLLFERLGARRTFLRIMALWGCVVIGTAFVTTPVQFYVMRLLLGLFEAGFFPGMILYLTYWFPSAQRARVTAIVFFANALASTIAGPLTGFLMTSLEGVLNLHGWQWALILEGIPAIIMGIVCFVRLDDGPRTAKWLSQDEKALVIKQLKRDAAAPAPLHGRPLWVTLKDPGIYLLGLIYFAPTSVNYLFNFWLPTMIRESGVDKLMNIGWLTAIPMLTGIVGMFCVNFSSDLFRERRWHLIGSFILAGGGLLASIWLKGSFAAMLAALCVANFGINAIGPLFWTLPPTYLRPETTPSGIAVISTLGITAGFISPTFVGYVRAQTGDVAPAIYAIAGLMFLCIPLLIWVVPQRAMRVESLMQ